VLRPNEITLVDAAVDALLTDNTPAHLIGDNAYDSSALNARLRQECRIEMIAPPPASPPPGADAGWASASPVSPALEDRTALCLAAQLPSVSHAVRTSRRQLPRLRPAGLHHDPAAASSI